MQSAQEIAAQLTPDIQEGNAELGPTNRRIVKIGNGEGLSQPENPLYPREVFFRSATNQNDRGLALLGGACGITLDTVDGYYDLDFWAADMPKTKQTVIMEQVDLTGLSTGGVTPAEQQVRAAAFPSQDRLALLRVLPSFVVGMNIYVDVGPYAISFERPDGTMGFLVSADVDVSDSTNAVMFVPTATALAAGEHRILGIAFSPSLERFIVIPGATVSTTNTLPSNESRSEFVEADYAAINFSGYAPCGYMYNYFGQSDPDEDDCMRQFDPRLLARAMNAVSVNAVIVAPDSATRNTITPTATTYPNLILKAIAAQTADFLQFLSSAGTMLAKVTAAGLAQFASLLVGGTSLDASAVAQIDSTTKGFAAPRMTTTQRDAISSPLEGLMIYNTTTHQYEQRTNSSWVAMGGSSSSGEDAMLLDWMIN